MDSALSIGGLALMILGVGYLGVSRQLFSPAPWCIALQAGAVALMLWARVTFGARSFHASAGPTEGGVVSNGPYRFIRHPIYTAACLFTIAGAAAHPSPVTFGCGALVFLGSWIRMRAEEKLLVATYPDYRAYADRTRRMVPFIF